MHAARGSHIPAVETAGEYWEGSETGEAAATLAYVPLTVQQGVPNMQQVNHAPQTQVIPELEQGEGRSPGWKWAWMRKNISYAPDHIMGHQQRNFGPLRDEIPLGYQSTVRLTNPGNSPIQHFGKTPPVTLEPPHTVYNTAVEPQMPTWGEPL